MKDFLNNCNMCGNDNSLVSIKHDSFPANQCSPFTKEELSHDVLGSIAIARCNHCSHVFNKNASKEIVNQMYFNPFSASLPTRPEHFERLRGIISNTFPVDEIKGETVIEIGASDFTFCELLLENGVESILAFEPSSAFSNTNSKITHLKEYFSWDVVPEQYKDTKLIFMRHVLEHLFEPREFFEQISQLKEGSYLYIEVPCLDDIIIHGRYYDFFYEHINYFSKNVLRKLFNDYGFEVIKENYLYNGQHMGFLGRLNKDIEAPTEAINDEQASLDKTLFDNFNHNCLAQKSQLKEIFMQYPRVAIYGAGGHAVSAIHFAEIPFDKVSVLLDMNPYKENKYSPGSHHLIQKPSKEIVDQLDAIVIIAALHEKEIHHILRNDFSFTGDIYGIFPQVQKLR